jgi:hypothetical protein
MAFIIVPTYYLVYKVADRENRSREFVQEFKSKGKAIEWIYKEGEKEVYYIIEEYYKM